MNSTKGAIAGGAVLILLLSMGRGYHLRKMSPRRALEMILRSSRSKWLAWLADGVSSHRARTYLALAVLAIVTYRGQDWLRRSLRLIMRYDAVNPVDELTQYPHPDRGDSESVVSGDDASEAGSASPRAGRSAAAVPAASVSSGMLKDMITTDSELPPFQDSTGAGNRVLSMVGHMFQLTQAAAVSLAQKSKELQLQPGEPLFAARDDAVDGVFLVLSGSLQTSGDPRGAAFVVDDCLLHAGERGGEWTAGGTAGHTSSAHGLGFGYDTTLYTASSMTLASAAEESHVQSAAGAPPTLCEFGTGSTIGENSLLEGKGASRAVSVHAGAAGASLVKIDRSTYQWFVSQWPCSTLNFILSTTARQYRVAFFALVDFLGLPQAAFAAQESHPEPRVQLRTAETVGAETPQGQHVHPNALRSVAASVCEMASGDTLFKEGDASDCLYVLLEGGANAYVQPPAEDSDAASRRGGSVATRTASELQVDDDAAACGPGDSLWVGELAQGSVAGGISCFVNIPRRATVVCNQPCTWAVFSRRQFLAAARNRESDSAAASAAPHVLAHIAQEVARSLTPLLRMFLGLGLQRVWLSAGDTLYSAGDASDGMYLVISGRLRINLKGDEGGDERQPEDGDDGRHGSMHVTRGGMHRKDDAGTAALALAMGQPLSRVDVTRGESVGEVAVLRRPSSGSAPQRDHTVQCVRDCELVRISPAAFDWIASAHPDIMRQFAITMAQRYSSLLGRMHGTTHAGPPNSVSSISQELQAALQHGALRKSAEEQQQPGAGEGRLRRSSSMGRVTHAVSIAGLNLMSSITRATASGTQKSRGRGGSAGALPSGGEGGVLQSGSKSDISTICILPSGASPPSAQTVARFVADLVGSLKAHGDVRVVDSHVLDEEFGAGTAHGSGASSVFTRARISAWLCSQEERHRFMVMVCDVHMPHWCATAYSQADLALLVAEAGSDPAPHPVEELLSDHGRKRRHAPHSDAPVSAIHAKRPSQAMHRLASRLGLAEAASGALQGVHYLQHLVAPGSGSDANAAQQPHVAAGSHVLPVRAAFTSFARRELVLLHADCSKPPKNTRAWLRHRTLSWHHHVRLEHATDDIARVARFVAGAAVGVVLGGGGARGLAHLGMLKSMEQNGVPIDFIGGTSQGAFIGGCYALAMSAVQAGESAKVMATQIGSPLLVLRMTLPIMSYFSGALFNDILQSVFGDTQIEDLWVKYFCVSTNITRDTMDVHQVGPVWRYARASMTVMGLVPPIMDVNGDLLVDGGYTNNMPVDCMYAMCPTINTVVACDVENKDNSAVENVDPEEYGDSVSGWYLLARILTSAVGIGKPLTIPSLSALTLKMSYISHTMAMRSMIARLRQAAAQGDPNVPKFLYVRPDVQDYSLLQYNKYNEIVNHGFLESQRVFGDFLRPIRSPRLSQSGGRSASGPGRPRVGSGSHIITKSTTSSHRRAVSHAQFSQVPMEDAVAELAQAETDGAPSMDGDESPIKA